MQRCILGDLQDWGHVLERLEELGRSGQLEQHQEVLIGLLRRDDNWRLREAALESVQAIRQPTEPLVREVSGIMMNRGLYFQARVLAAEALGACLKRLADSSGSAAMRIRHDVREQMHALLASHDVPLLHQAVRRILPNVE
jgi:hypothetical protein